MRAMSFGGGVQSTAMLVLAARKEIDFPTALFANVGDDSENPDTLAYIANHSRPYAESHGIEFVELRKIRRDGRPETILQWLDRTQKTIGIPMRMENGAPGNRTCTYQFKITVIRQELKRRGASPKNPASVALGISMDEWQRMRDSGHDAYKNEYPLIDLGLTRQDCVGVITEAGLPVPPKSSCWFCPFTKLGDWRAMRREHPDRFESASALEQKLNERRAAIGKDRVYLTYRAVPLAQAVGEYDQMDLFDEVSCDIAGHCHS